MPFISVNGLSVIAAFDGSSSVSALPMTAMDYLQSLSAPPFLVTAPTPRGTFSTSLTFQCDSRATATLGMDWFASVREFYIGQGLDPPVATSFSFSTCKAPSLAPEIHAKHYFQRFLSMN